MTYAGKSRLGIAIVAAGLLGALGCYLWPKGIMKVPLDIPLDLGVGHLQTREFTTSVSSQYRVAIHFERGAIPFDKLDCEIGMNIADVQPCPKVHGVLDVFWTLAADGVPVSHGLSSEFRGASYSSGEVDRYIGMFDARRGVRYRLDVRLLQDSSELAVANPHLRVEPNLNGVEGWLMLTGLFFYVSLFCAALGAVLLVVARRHERADELSARLRATTDSH